MKPIEERIADLRRQIDEKTEASLQEALKDLDSRIHSIVEQRISKIVAATLGLEDRWGRVEVDHCNGRQTAVANAIGEMAMAQIDRQFPEWIKQAIGNDKLPKGWKQAIRKEYDERLNWRLRELVKDHAESVIQTNAEKLLEEAIKMEPPKPKRKKDEEDKYEPLPE